MKKIMYVSSIQQFNRQQNIAAINTSNRPIKVGMLAFKGAKEIEAAKKIIAEHAGISAKIKELILDDSPGFTANALAMMQKISGLYKIDFDKAHWLKFITDELIKTKESDSKVKKGIQQWGGNVNFTDPLMGMKFIFTTGRKFVQHCEKIQKGTV